MKDHTKDTYTLWVIWFTKAAPYNVVSSSLCCAVTMDNFSAGVLMLEYGSACMVVVCVCWIWRHRFPPLALVLDSFLHLSGLSRRAVSFARYFVGPSLLNLLVTHWFNGDERLLVLFLWFSNVYSITVVVYFRWPVQWIL